MKHSSRLLPRWPKEDNVRESYLRWASYHIQEQLIYKLSEQSFSRASEQLCRGTEAHPYTFETKALPGGETEKLKIPAKPKGTITRKAKEFKSTDLTARELLLHGIGNFPCIDLFIGW